MAYSNQTKVGYYDCDESSNIRISAALRAMQQVAGDHLDDLSLPYEKLHEEHMVFLLSKACVKIHQMPVAGQEIIVKTSPHKTKGPLFIRDIVIEDLQGKRYISNKTFWILVDPESRKVLRPKVFCYDLHYENSMTDGFVEEEKIPKITDEIPSKEATFPVVYSYIDNNGHVNNSFYVDFACDMLPYGKLITQGIDTITISYQSEAVYGDSITLKRYDLGNDRYHFVGTKNDSPCFEVLIQLGDNE